MKESKRNTTMLIIITIAVFLVAVLGATYAYFATERNVGASLNANVQTASSMYSFSATSNGNIEMNIAFNEMSEANVSNNVLKSDNATIEVNLASPTDEMLTVCTYDIVWIWDSAEMYTKADVDTLPYIHQIPITEAQYFDLSFKCPTGYIKVPAIGRRHYCESAYNEFSTTIDGANETDLSVLPRNEKTVTLQSGASISATSTTPVVRRYDIRANIYNLPVEQTNLFGKIFKAHVTIDNLNCNMTDIQTLPSLATYIKENVYTSQVNQDSIGATPKAAGLYYHDLNLENGANDNTYRYAGGYSYPKASEGYNSYDSILTKGSYDSTLEAYAYTLTYDETNTKYKEAEAEAKAINDGYLEEVNNYVCFAEDSCSDINNLYRIISVDSSNQTKVIKARSIGVMSWEDSYLHNVWENASLQKYLNATYLTSLGTKANKIVDTEWSVGGALRDDLDKNARAFMDVELNKSTTLTRKIGLMYGSEYGFAALPEYWGTEMYNYDSSYRKDWILTPMDTYYLLTISRFSDSEISAMAVSAESGSLGGSSGDDGYVRPTFNLSPDVKIINADSPNVGSKSNPMIIT